MIRSVGVASSLGVLAANVPGTHWWTRLLALVPVATLGLCLGVLELPYFVESPGSARSVLPLIDIDGAPTYDSDGRFLLTTVNIGRVNVYYAIRAAFDPVALLVPEDEVIPPGETEQEYERRSFSQMDQSKIAAVVVALDRLTEYPEEHGPGVIVYETFGGTPADGRLFPGDVITAADGERVDGLRDLTSVITEAGAGTRIRFTVRPLEGGEEEAVPLRPIRDPGGGGPIIGISSVANFPFTVRIGSGAIGGPSAGLMWAVGVTDLLASEDLTGGQAVAGTGTVGVNGDVGAIGGIQLKIVAAERAGAKIFLLPQDNLVEARGVETDIRLVPVQNVDQAIRFLGERT